MSLQALMGRTSVLTLRLWAGSQSSSPTPSLPSMAKDAVLKQTKINGIPLIYLTILYTSDSILYSTPRAAVSCIKHTEHLSFKTNFTPSTFCQQMPLTLRCPDRNVSGSTTLSNNSCASQVPGGVGGGPGSLMSRCCYLPAFWPNREYSKPFMQPGCTHIWKWLPEQQSYHASWFIFISHSPAIPHHQRGLVTLYWYFWLLL